MNVRLVIRITILGVLFTFALSGCMLQAASRRGLSQMNAGNCKAAVDTMSAAAMDGDGYSINNLGVISERGCPEANVPQSWTVAYKDFIIAGQKGVPIAFSNAGLLAEGGTPEMAPNLALAIQLYTMGARYGDPASIAALTRLGQSVPSPDLQEQAEDARRQEQMSIALAVMDAAAIANGVHPAATPTLAAPNHAAGAQRTSNYFGLAFWTGGENQVTTITDQQGWNCEYAYDGQTFWRTFVGSCPASINVQ